MKKIATLFLIMCFTVGLQAQVGVGRPDVSNGSVSLQFGDTENKGLILPYVTNTSMIIENGTLIYDATAHKVKYFKDSSWFDLSVDPTGIADLSIQGTNRIEHEGAKVTISSRLGGTDTTDGILVLADNDKAMVLPKVASPHLNIISPASGMIVYDTVKRQLAVYNGRVWSFWKP